MIKDLLSYIYVSFDTFIIKVIYLLAQYNVAHELHFA